MIYKTKIYIAFIIAILALDGCKKDKNNYDQEEAEIIAIEGLSEKYEVIADKDILKISIKASSNKEGADFEYYWGIAPQTIQGKLDTIANGKTLEYPIHLTADTYTLVSIVKNKRTGLSKYSDVDLVVSTEYTRGWYVLKDNGIEADLDQFVTAQSIVPEGKNEDVFSRLNGHKLSGKGTRLDFLADYKSTVASETPADTRTLFAGSEKDIAAIYINTLRAFRDKNSISFVGDMDGKDMVAVHNGGSSIFLFNQGHLHGVSTASVNSGFFGGYMMRDALNTPYQLSPFFSMSSSSSLSYFFDDMTSSFVSASGASFTLGAVPDAPGSQLPANNNNQNLLYLAYQNAVLKITELRYEITSWALFQDKSSKKKSLGKLVPNKDNQLMITLFPVAENAKLNNSSNYSLAVQSEELLYFVHDGREIYSYGLNSGGERLQYTIPPGEEVSFIRHRTFGETGFKFDYVIVGTSVGNRYKIRMFKKVAGNLSAEPEFTLEGTGIPRDVIYISPKVNNNTYPVGY